MEYRFSLERESGKVKKEEVGWSSKPDEISMLKQKKNIKNIEIVEEFNISIWNERAGNSSYVRPRLVSFNYPVLKVLYCKLVTISWCF